MDPDYHIDHLCKKLVKYWKISLSFDTLSHDMYYLPYTSHLFHHICTMVFLLGASVHRLISINCCRYCKDEQ